MTVQIDCILPQNITQFYTDPHWKETLQYLLARATLHECPKNFTQIALCYQLLDVPFSEKQGIAPFTGLADQLNTTENYWLSADPQYLVIENNQLFARDFICNTLHSNQINTVFNKLQTLLTDYEITLHAPCYERWYLSMPFDPKLNTINIEQLQQKGIPIENWLTEHSNNRLERQVPWKKIFTEVQMILHESKLPFNSLWFWGGGFLPPKTVAAFTNQSQSIKKYVYSKLPFIQGLARWKNYEVSYDLTQWAKSIRSLTDKQHYIFVFDNKLDQETLQFFKQLVKMLKEYSIHQVRLYDFRGRMYYLTPYIIRKFWRYKIPL